MQVFISILLVISIGMNIALFMSMINILGYLIERDENRDEALRMIENKINWIKERVGA